MTSTVFKSSFNRMTYFWAFAQLIILLFFSYRSIEEGQYVSSATALLCISMLYYFGIFYPKVYEISDKKLVYKALLEKRSINIEHINCVEKVRLLENKRLLNFLFPSKATLKVYYGKFNDEMVINPHDQQEFLEKLRMINPAISIK